MGQFDASPANFRIMTTLNKKEFLMSIIENAQEVIKEAHRESMKQ